MKMLTITVKQRIDARERNKRRSNDKMVKDEFDKKVGDFEV